METTLYHEDSIIATLRPKRAVVHDLIDFSSRNHHNRRDPEHAAAYEACSETVAKEVWKCGRFLRELEEAVPEVAVVPSNHHEAMRKWIHETDWREDIQNADIYLAAARAMVRYSAENGPYHRLDVLKWAIRDYCEIGLSSCVKFLDQDERYEIKGIECGMHGHVGPSGSRGSPTSFAKLPFKTFTAHTHSPSIRNGCYTVGLTGSLDLGYNRGPSKWMHAHGIIYPNGKRAFLFVKNRKWRA